MEEHGTTGKEVASKYPGVHDDEFYTEQTWKADQMRATDEEYANELLDRLKKDHPDADVMGRLKDRTSMTEKLAQYPEKYNDVSEIRDIVGMRIASPEDIAGVKETVGNLKNRYNVVQEKNMIDKPTDLGYRDYHLIIEDTGIETELQVRTYNQDVWANYTHDNIYIPNEEPKRII